MRATEVGAGAAAAGRADWAAVSPPVVVQAAKAIALANMASLVEFIILKSPLLMFGNLCIRAADQGSTMLTPFIAPLAVRN
jgi:hypothetical protein